MKVLIDQRWSGMHGIGRITYEVMQFLQADPTVDLEFVGRDHINFPVDPLFLSSEIARHKPDLFFSPGFNPPLFFSIPIILTLCDLIPLHFAETRNPGKILFYNTVVRSACRRSAGILTISDHAKREILEWGEFQPEKVHRVYLAAGREFEPEGMCFKNRRPYYLYIGNGSPHKNVPRLVEAFAFSGLSREFDLLLGGMAAGYWSDLIGKWGLEGSVREMGLLPDEELPSLYRGAYCFAFPSLYEGFGLPPLEAMACGTPVVVSNTTSLPEVVGEAGYYVDPLDVESIADGLLRMTDQTLHEELAQKGLDQAQQFSWEKTIAEIWRMMRDAAAS
ncbi:MAG: glycosyltransferase family 4 protein [Anaerolineales bacterium]|nr:glycosyltransferase family 4 protein [Anaerolineales bacterium]